MTLIESLKAIVGEVNASEAELDRIAYGNAKAVVWPSNAEEVHKIVMLARRAGVPITARGAGVGLRFANDIIVDMSKMNSVITVANDYVEAEAGVLLDDVNKLLKGKVFPVQPESAKACSIGGMIAANALGIKAMEFGKTGKWVEEVKMVDGNGICLTLKGDALRHVVGLRGATGIILSAKLRLSDAVERTAELLKFNTLTAMQEKLDELKNDADVRNIEFMDEISSSLLGFGMASHLIVDYAGDKGMLKGAEAKEAWDARKQLPFVLGQKRYLNAHELQMPLESITRFLNLLRKDEVPCYGPIGLGVLCPVFRDDSSFASRTDYVYRQFNAKKRKTSNPETEKRVLELKAHYDPKNILSRGKFI
ncbi:MAG: FAD-binding oxidoreductase [Nanoarchaeota archaeon]|nr:FAD-binding oxidoreductase [Nanoarchaeota archaeon]